MGENKDRPGNTGNPEQPTMAPIPPHSPRPEPAIGPGGTQSPGSEEIAAAQTPSTAPPSGTITFLFTDIEGSSQLWEKHPRAMPAALERHNQLLQRAMESHGGFVFKTVGDAFYVAFVSAPLAMAAALAGQQALAAEPWGETGPLLVRMALHTGVAEERDGDYFGPTLNRVARVLAAGQGGQILLSNATEQLVRDHLTDGVILNDLGERSLKNLSRAERIFQISLPNLPTRSPTLSAAPQKSAQQVLRSPAMLYGMVGAVALALLAGLLLWSPWKNPGNSGRLPVSSGVAQQGGQGARVALAPKSPSANPKLGDTMVTTTGVELVYIPPGEFMMGSSKLERAWAQPHGQQESVKAEGEAPRKTTIKQGFWLGRTEVTVGQWKEFVTATGYMTDAEKKGYIFVRDSEGKGIKGEGKNWRDPGFGTPPPDDHPVCCISWNDAVAFCEWLTERERKAGRLMASQVVRLPTEAEWEYACRAGTQTIFWWGDDEKNFRRRCNLGGASDGYEFTSPVDRYGEQGRNKFGLADMLGNVLEWCLDEYDPTQAHEECYKGDPGLRVRRGGAFFFSSRNSRCACRWANSPTYSSWDGGFRLAIGGGVSRAAPSAATDVPKSSPPTSGSSSPP